MEDEHLIVVQTVGVDLEELVLLQFEPGDAFVLVLFEHAWLKSVLLMSDLILRERIGLSGN